VTDADAHRRKGSKGVEGGRAVEGELREGVSTIGLVRVC
jgi:hypothetical protein